MAILKNIAWQDDSKNTIVHKYDMGKDQVNTGSALTVSESQAAVFIYKGKLADVYLPGFYKLNTDNMPILTKLMSWKYGFETPFKADIYFVNTKQFTNQKWGTATPILIRDKEYGAVRVRGYGAYSFKVTDAYLFMQNLSGTNSSYETSEITDYLRGMVVSGISDAVGESKISVLDMAGNLNELASTVEQRLNENLKEIGVKISQFTFESFSLPEEIEKALDKNLTMNIYRNNMDVYSQIETLEALKNASKNEGSLGGTMGAGFGLGMGTNMANMFNQNMNAPVQKTNTIAQTATQSGAFCSECGATIKPNSKFCSECGAKLSLSCPKCGSAVRNGAKFCGECGEKL